MLSKKKISFPSEANLLKAIKFSDTIEILDNCEDNLHKVPDKDRDIYNELVKHIIDKRYIRVFVDSIEDTAVVHIPRISTNTNKSELNSSIKKYIRKEKRRLDKSGQSQTLFKMDHPNRINLIEKIYKLFINKVLESNKNVDLRQLITDLIDGYRV